MFAHASMNRIYRLVWSEAAGVWIAVAEHARGRGKAGRSAVIAAALATLGLGQGAHAAPPVAPPAPTQLPTGAKVVAGTVAVSQSGAQMAVTQTTQRGVVDWASFNVGAQARVDFVQPSAAAVTLNRVLDSQASQIFGKVTANGQVFLTNPNGLYFSPTSTVDVGGLVATTHAISTADFMAGGSTLRNEGATGSVVNDGSLHASLGGYVALLAPEVRNGGVVVARAGTVALAAGDAFRLQFEGMNTLAGVIVTPAALNALVENRRAVLAPGGLIILSAQARNALSGGVVNNSGRLEATGLVSDGGRIVLEASDRISHTGSINADALAASAGKGGTVTVIASLANAASATVIDGSISARGGDRGGDGGAIETSGSRLTIADATRVDARAPQGKSGTWLLDPDGFTIAASGGDISGATLSANLATADVVLTSTSGTGSGGNLDVNDAVSWGAHKLTLAATREININAVMSASGSASLDLEAGGGSGNVNTAFGANNTFKGKVNFSGSGTLMINDQFYTVINSLGANRGTTTSGTLQGAQASQNTYYALGSDIDASPTAAWNTLGVTGFEPIIVYNSAFNGLGHTIAGLVINRCCSYTALISNTGQYARISNVGTVGGSATGNLYSAGLVGDNRGSIRNSFSTMTVIGTQRVGGLVGSSNVGSSTPWGIVNSYATGDVSGSSWVGGLVGEMLGGMIQNSYATGAVTGTVAFTGGLAGLNYFGQISNSYATGNVVGAQSVGGLVGVNQAAGGVSSTIVNSYARGSVSGNTIVGGLAGENGAIVRNSYSTGAVSGNTLVGGLIGSDPELTSTVTNSFWDTQTSGRATSIGGTGKTTAEMKTLATFTGAGWDFASAPVWRIKAAVNDGYPCLAFFGSCSPFDPLTVRVNGTQTASVYGDAVGTFSYSLYNGATLLDAASEAALGISLGGVSLFGGAPTATSGAGLYSVTYASGLTLGGANAATYALVAGAGLSYTVAKRPLVLAGTKVYDQGTAFAAGTLVASNLVGADCVGGLAACGLGGSGSVASKNVAAGSQALAVGTLALTSALDSNYTLTGFSGSAVVTPRALTVVATGANRVYNGSVADNVTLTDDRLAGDALTVSRTSAAFADKNVGTGKAVSVAGIALSGTDAGNYSLQSSTASTSADITQRPLEVFANGTSRVYDATTAATATLVPDDSVVFGDQLSYAYTGASFADKNVGVGKAVGVVGIGISGADAGNYSLSNTTATARADITRRPLVVTATGTSRVYDGGTTDAVTLADDRIAGDVLTLANTAASFADKNVGSAKAVTVTGVSASGTDSGNYSVAPTVATIADITPRPLDVYATGTHRVYDGSTAVAVTLTAGDALVAGDVLTLAAGAATFADKNVGTHKAVAVTGIGASGADAGNYSIASTASTFADVTPRFLDVAAIGSNRVYDGTTAGTVTLQIGDSLVAGDIVAVSAGTASFADKNAGLHKAISVGGVTASGADAGNYSTPTELTGYADVARRALAVTAAGTSRVYDGTTGAAVTLGLGDTLIAGDTVTVSAASAAFADKNAGTAKAIAVSGIATGGADGANYAVDASAVATADVTPRTLDVAATGTNRVYDATSAAALVLADNRIAGDALTLTATGLMADKNVGVGKIVAVSGLTVAGSDAANYNARLSNDTTRADIAVRDLVVTAHAASRAFDGSTAVTVVLSDDRAGSDQLILTSAAARFADAAIGDGKVVSVSGIAVAGSDSANYRLLQSSAETTASIMVGASTESAVPRAPVVVPVTATTTRALSPLTLTPAAYSPTPSSGEARVPTADITVTLVRESTRGGSGNVSVSVPARILGNGEGFGFALPSSLAEALSGGATAFITRSDGTPLPGWLRYVPESGSFDASAAAAGGLPIELTITIGGRSWSLVISEGTN